MSQKLCVCAYVPPQKLPYAEPFLRNVRKHKSKHDLLLYSDHDWPDVKRLRGTPEVLSGEKDRHNRDKAWTISNLVFFTGIDLAIKAGYSHALYVEADSRVLGDGWDAKIFDEFFNQAIPPIIGGSMVVHNPAASGIVGLRRWSETVIKNKRRNFPIPTYGDVGAGTKKDSCVFVMGSGMVIDLAWFPVLFAPDEIDRDLQPVQGVHQFGLQPRVIAANAVTPENDFWPTRLARDSRPFDVEIGSRLWRHFGPDAYDVVANLTSEYSSYGETLTSEDERIKMLLSGEISLCHQAKSNVEV